MPSLHSAHGLALFFCDKYFERLFYNPGIKFKDYLYYTVYKCNFNKINTMP